MVNTPPPSSPPTKNVSFAAADQVAPTPLLESPCPSPSITTTTTTTTTNSSTSTSAFSKPPPPKRRRSSLKQGLQMPILPPKQLYQHPDPLVRRLRLRDSYGNQVDLETRLRDTKVILFVFGAAWPGSSPEPYNVVESFAKRNPHRLTVVYVSVDSTESAYERQTRGKPWLSMEWNDGSNLGTSSPSASSPLPDPPTPSEPFLLAGDTDLEEDMHQTDPTGSLYLRPYSRVFLAEKFQVLGVPNVAVYHLGKREMLSTHARLELMKGEKAEGTWEKWEKGERISFSASDLVYSLRWSLSAAAVAASYVVAVRWGGAPDIVGKLSDQLTRNFLGH
ncbi:hypothetical protein BCR35DRAFT_307929 [Leucosporidium creatinivorum]|uniref:Uncharacterized protein n=1 Tax=Leucosporidium creatinivorum TaxID=106004 RepID=A0A1Y2EGD3_9BASI|nr:hypothetical protein BCR35DRAFT_307929 [Leucosporidium creatinivorum]